jgi:hypothetical protein
MKYVELDNRAHSLSFIGEPHAEVEIILLTDDKIPDRNISV